MIQKLQVLIIVLLIPLGGLYLYSENRGVSISELLVPGNPIVHIGDIPLRVEVAATEEAKSRGLSGRDEIGADGLLFVYDTSDYHGIWMKDMRFPIDVIWIGENNTVVGITRDLQPESFPRVFEPPQPVRHLIETNTHFSDTFGIQVGDAVRLPAEVQ